MRQVLAGGIEVAEGGHSRRTFRIRCTTDPMQAILGALLHSLTPEIKKPEIQLRYGVPIGGGAHVPLGRFHEILDSLRAGLVQMPEVVLCSGIAAVRRHRIPLDRFINIFIDSVATVVRQTDLELRSAISRAALLGQSLPTESRG